MELHGETPRRHSEEYVVAKTAVGTSETTTVSNGRCSRCRKKSLLMVDCRYCHGSFCLHDRHPEVHQCQNLHPEKVVLERVEPKKIDKI